MLPVTLDESPRPTRSHTRAFVTCQKLYHARPRRGQRYQSCGELNLRRTAMRAAASRSPPGRSSASARSARTSRPRRRHPRKARRPTATATAIADNLVRRPSGITPTTSPSVPSGGAKPLVPLRSCIAALAAPRARLACYRARRLAARGTVDAGTRQHRHDQRLSSRPAGHIEWLASRSWGVSSMKNWARASAADADRSRPTAALPG